MRRREFIAGLAGAAAWPLVARAQTDKPVRLGYLEGGGAHRSRRSRTCVASSCLACAISDISRAGDLLEGAATPPGKWTTYGLCARTGLELNQRRRDRGLAAKKPRSVPPSARRGQIPICHDSSLLIRFGSGLVANLAHPGGNLTKV